jgi:hypothetical protein
MLTNKKKLQQNRYTVMITQKYLRLILYRIKMEKYN